MDLFFPFLGLGFLFAGLGAGIGAGLWGLSKLYESSE